MTRHLRSVEEFECNTCGMRQEEIDLPRGWTLVQISRASLADDKHVCETCRETLDLVLFPECAKYNEATMRALKYFLLHLNKEQLRGVRALTATLLQVCNQCGLPSELMVGCRCGMG